MPNTLLISLLLLLPCEPARAVTHAQANIATDRRPSSSPSPQEDEGECADVPSCREVIKKLKAELGQTKGGEADPQKKARRAVIARRLQKTQSRLARLQGRGGESGTRTPSTAAGPPPPPLPSAPPLKGDALLEALASVLEQPEKRIAERVERGGNVQIVKALSVGVLKVEYDKDVPAGSAFRLTATITPRDILEESLLKDFHQAPLTFYIEPLYEPQRSSAEYNEGQSGGAALREFRPGEPMTWVWDVTPPAGFAKDKADLILRAKIGVAERHTDWREVSRSEIEFKESTLVGWAYAHPGEVLGALAGTLTLIAAILSLVTARRGREVRRLNRAMNRRRKFLLHKESLLRDKEGEISSLRDAHDKMKLEYDAFKRRWERLVWLRQLYR